MQAMRWIYVLPRLLRVKFRGCCLCSCARARTCVVRVLAPSRAHMLAECRERARVGAACVLLARRLTCE
eukprot:1625678-Pleurochrysis_carterae.AAC.1